MAYCAQLQKEFGKFKDDFELVGTHLDRAQKKFSSREAPREVRDEARAGVRLAARAGRAG
jgi:DNA anti-recombination protein RmuC